MERSKIENAEFRFGDWGPGYLMRGPRIDVGVVQLRAGDAFTNHYHAKIEECFIVLEGEATLWSDCKDKFTHRAGDRSEEHTSELQSRGHVVCRLLRQKRD